MKFLLLTVLALAAISTSSGFKECPDKIPKGTPTAPKAGKYYQVMEQAKKNDKASCYNLKFSDSGKTLKVEQSMVVDSVTLNHTYLAVANENGTWDVSMNGMPSSRIFVTSIAPNILGILSCEQKRALTIQSGVFSTAKALTKTEISTVKAALAKFKIAEKHIADIDQSKCKN